MSSTVLQGMAIPINARQGRRRRFFNSLQWWTQEFTIELDVMNHLSLEKGVVEMFLFAWYFLHAYHYRILTFKHIVLLDITNRSNMTARKGHASCRILQTSQTPAAPPWKTLQSSYHSDPSTLHPTLRMSSLTSPQLPAAPATPAYK